RAGGRGRGTTVHRRGHALRRADFRFRRARRGTGCGGLAWYARPAEIDRPRVRVPARRLMPPMRGAAGAPGDEAVARGGGAAAVDRPLDVRARRWKGPALSGRARLAVLSAAVLLLLV